MKNNIKFIQWNSKYATWLRVYITLALFQTFHSIGISLSDTTGAHLRCMRMTSWCVCFVVRRAASPNRTRPRRGLARHLKALTPLIEANLILDAFATDSRVRPPRLAPGDNSGRMVIAAISTSLIFAFAIPPRISAFGKHTSVLIEKSKSGVQFAQRRECSVLTFVADKLPIDVQKNRAVLA